MKPTLEHVAEAAGVSRATASRVINGSSRVSDEVKIAVERAVQSLGYVPNRAARSLVTKRTESVAFVVRETETRFFSEPFFAGIVRGVGHRLTELGFQMVLAMAKPSDDPERLERYLMTGHMDGALLVSMHGDDPLLRALIEAQVPTVIGGRTVGNDEASSVDADNPGGARAAVEHLIAGGRSHIATIAGPRDMGVGIDRYSGYEKGLLAAGLRVDESLVAESDFTQEGGAQAMEELLDRRPDLDAVFAASDLMAAGALQVLLHNGKRVPDEVAVVGFDDSSVALFTDPPLSSVKQPLETMGRHMADMLLAHIVSGDRSIRREVLPTELVIRGSS